jgi:excisionase family DNA binding protein
VNATSTLPPSGAAEPSYGKRYLTTAAPDKLLDAGEVAELLHVSRRWVEDAARSGTLPHLRLGKYVRFRRDAILAWTAAQEQGGR